MPAAVALLWRSGRYTFLTDTLANLGDCPYAAFATLGESGPHSQAGLNLG